MTHKFHIPVLGLGFSIDTPLKVAKYGISSVVSIVDDELIERIRAFHCEQRGIPFLPIPKKSFDSRARRITAYLNLLDSLVNEDFESIKKLSFGEENELKRYFELLPEDAQLKQGYDLMMEYPPCEQKDIFQRILKSRMTKGSIDVNIMSKVDRLKVGLEGDAEENSDALAALRGFAQSNLQSLLTLSAGMNPRLYSYLEKFPDFYPDQNSILKKKIVLKVSDFRSAFIQAKFLAKKGLWVSEFRVESGLNCGGHAFATAGFLLGPILHEFKEMRSQMKEELFEIYQSALKEKGFDSPPFPLQRLSVQGGIGTSQENEFLYRQYQIDSTGWGSPFLLVPEVTNVDEQTLEKLTAAKEDSFYFSNASPLGILFNNLKNSTIEEERLMRIAKNRPGSPCTKKYLCTNTEFTTEPICTASREYQYLKIEELKGKTLSESAFKEQLDTITEKICLCEGLCSSAYQKLGILNKKESRAVAVCPGPNLAYFSKIYSLEELVGHIYGRNNLIEEIKRPNFLVKELELYVEYFKTEIKNAVGDFTSKKQVQLTKFRSQLLMGINYYKDLFSQFATDYSLSPQQFYHPLLQAEAQLKAISL